MIRVLFYDYFNIFVGILQVYEHMKIGKESDEKKVKGDNLNFHQYISIPKN